MFKVSNWMILSLRIQRSFMEMLMKSTDRIQTNCLLPIVCIIPSFCIYQIWYIYFNIIICVFLCLLEREEQRELILKLLFSRQHVTRTFTLLLLSHSHLARKKVLSLTNCVWFCQLFFFYLKLHFSKINYNKYTNVLFNNTETGMPGSNQLGGVLKYLCIFIFWSREQRRT